MKDSENDLSGKIRTEVLTQGYWHAVLVAIDACRVAVSLIWPGYGILGNVRK